MFAQSLQARPDRGGWSIDAIPQGLVPVLDEAIRNRPIHESHGLDYQGPSGSVELTSVTDTATAAEARVADALEPSVAASNTTVRATPAAVIRSADGRTRVIWYDDERGVVHELDIFGTLGEQVESIVDSITEVDESTWTAMLDSTDTTYWEGDTPSSTRP